VKAFLEVLGFLHNGFRRQFWSQSGEDYVLAHLLDFFSVPTPKVYVDIGAADPRFGSSSFAFHRKGLRGIGIDPLLNTKDWAKYRPKDVALRSLMSDSSVSKIFYEFRPSAYSTSDSDLAERVANSGLAELVSSSSVDCTDWPTVLAVVQELWGDPDFLLFLDCEGGEVEILSNFPWKSHRKPIAVVVEEIEGLSGVAETQRILFDNGYLRVAFTGLSGIYLLNEKMSHPLVG
jgi:hypothetical protein